MRLKLVVDDPALAAFPWECLSDGGSFLGASIRTPLVRSLDLPEATRPLTASPPLRMLVVIPNDPELDASAEAASLRAALDRVGSGIQPTFLEGEVTRRRLTDATEAASYHILHVVGHGDFDGERAVLVLNAEDGGYDPVDATWVAALLRNQDRMRLVVLNSCRGASVSAIRPLTGIAPELVRLGIPAVVAMQDEIFDDDAIRFARAFYARLTVGEDRGRVDIALCPARNELLTEASGPLSVGIPVLFARSPDGVLFHIRSGDFADLPFEAGARDTDLAVMDALARTAKAARGEEREDVAEREAEELRRLRTRVRFRDASVLAAGAVALVVFFGFWMGVLDWLPKELKPEHYTVWIGDMLRENPLHEAVALVTIDPATFEALGHPYDPDATVFAPEWRMDHARILDRLGEAGATVVAFDFVFDAPRAHVDTAFARAIADGAAGRGPRVVLAARAWADDSGLEGASAEPHIAPSLWSAGPEWGTACLGLPRHAPNVVPLLARRPGVGARPALALATVAAARGTHTFVFDTASVNVEVVGDGVADLWVRAARIGRPAAGGDCSMLAVGLCDPPFARLTDVTVDDRPAAPPSELGQVQVVRDGSPLETRDLMTIEIGDTILTGPNARAVLDVGGRYQVFLDEGSELVVLNPRGLLRRGKAFFRRVVEEVREALEVNTPYTVAAPTGTAFLVEVPDEETARFLVSEGRLRVAPREEPDAEGPPRWTPVTYGPLEGGIVEGRAAPRPTPTLTPDALERELVWVRRTEAVTTTLVPMLRGASLEEARALRAGARLELGEVTERLQEGGQGGVVLTQQLPEGERARPGTTVGLEVSVAGVPVPDLIGMAESTANTRLQEAGLTVGERQSRRVAGERGGRVIEIRPDRRTLVPLGTPVSLVVSDMCVVPDLSGLERSVAEARIRDAVLRVGRVATAGGEVGPWTVVRGSQNPAAGTSVVCGGQVTFSVMGVIG